MTTVLDFMRHGEPVGGRKYRGQIDDPLSEKGWHQMRETVGEFAGWDVIVSSPLTRCHAFSEELAGRLQKPLHLDPRLKEVGFGEWEGKTAAELKASDPETLTRFKLDPVGARPAGAEPLEDFHARVGAALDSVLTHHAGKHVLVVCHAGVIRMVLAHALSMPMANAYRIHVASAALTRLVAQPTEQGILWQLRFLDGRVDAPLGNAD